jgi:hypothetical protein
MVPFPNVPNLHYDSSTDSGSLISDQSHLINPFAVGSQSTTFINDYEGFSSFLSGSTCFASALTTLPDDLDTLTLYEQASSDPQDLGEDFDRICSLFYRNIYISRDIDLPPSWSIEDFTRMILGEDEIRTPAYLAEVYSNLCECGIYSAYWQMALDYLDLISRSPLY